MINLLLNVLVLLISVFFYYIFVLNSSAADSKKDVMAGFICLVAIVLSMLFPFNAASGFIYDLRMIPFIIGLLYCSRTVGIFLLVGLILARFLINHDIGFYVTFTQALLIWLLSLKFKKEYCFFSQKKKLIVAIGILAVVWLMNLCIYVFLFPHLLTEHMMTTLLYHGLVLLLSTTLIIYILEYVRKNRAFEEELNQVEKVKVISQLAASVSHEVRNPLTVTRGFLQLLKDDSIDYQKRKEYLDLSLQELDRAQRIITDYLTYAKPSENSNFQLLQITHEINYLTQVMTPYALMQGVEITVRTIEEGSVIGDRSKFRQAILNLMKNGIEAMPSGGILLLAVFHTGPCLVITIQDNGEGMTSDQISRLGSPYHTTKTKGTGLGTMVAFSIIRAMNGKIKVNSQKGKGTTFIITLPTTKETEPLK